MRHERKNTKTKKLIKKMKMKNNNKTKRHKDTEWGEATNEWLSVCVSGFDLPPFHVGGLDLPVETGNTSGIL